MTLQGIGYGDQITKTVSGPIRTTGNRLELRKSLGDSPETGIVEWYVNRRHGLEQGFTLENRPGIKLGDAPLRVVIELSGGLRADLEDNGQTVVLSQPAGKKVMRYDHLAAFDALGRKLAARMELSDGYISLLVEDTGAFYPVTIDPIFTEIKKLTASDAASLDLFGNSVALSGDTAVVGALFNNTQAGSAYIYQQNNGGTDNWGEVKELVASDGQSGDTFGSAVAISNDTVVVGANDEDSTNGAAYVFTRNSGGTNNWGEVKKLTPSAGTGPYRFGTSVGISGDTIVVGAPFDTASRGSAYVFERNLGGANNWGLARRLTATDGEAGDDFGISVAISIDLLVVGADQDDAAQGAAYIFGRNTGGAGNWGEVKKVIASDGVAGVSFGNAVDISLDTVVVAAALDDASRGAVYIFDRDLGGANNWGEVRKQVASDGVAGDNFGNSLRMSGDFLVGGAGADNAEKGTAYLFGRNQGGANQWAEVEKLTASDGVAGDQFGYSVGISGDVVAVGAYLKNSFTGAAYLYQVDPAQPIPVVRLNATTIQRSQTGSMTIDLTAVGGANPENTINLSIAFDPTHLVFISAVPGAGIGGATLNVDSSLSGSGRVGLQVVKSPGTGFTAGTHELVVMTFLALSNITLPSTQIITTNSPTNRIMLAADGLPLTAIWHNGTVTIADGCALTVSPLVRNFSAKIGSSTFNITATPGCPWEVFESIPWVTMTSATSGTGNGVVSFDVAVNSGTARSGVAYIAGYPVAIQQGANFLDVAQDDIFYEFIGKISAARITLGCSANGPLYCPSSTVTRGQMAAFIIRALGNFSPTTPATQRFLDVPPSDGFYPFIEDMALRSITLGCNATGPLYCPANTVTREQMAAFMIRAQGVYNPPVPMSQRFVDVPASNPFYAFIEEMALRGITLGCNATGPLYCPAGNVTRGQMAAFLVRAFGL